MKILKQLGLNSIDELIKNEEMMDLLSRDTSPNTLH
jgi:hypothetical protein